MTERQEFEMTAEQFDGLVAACQPTPAIMVGGVMPPTPQENANAYWRKLGDEMGFDWATVRPAPGANQRLFTAVPSE